MAQSSRAIASASLSSAGLYPSLRTAAIISSLPVPLPAPLPSTAFLIVATGTPWYGTLRDSHHAVRCAMNPP